MCSTRICAGPGTVYYVCERYVYLSMGGQRLRYGIGVFIQCYADYATGCYFALALPYGLSNVVSIIEYKNFGFQIIKVIENENF